MSKKVVDKAFCEAWAEFQAAVPSDDAACDAIYQFVISSGILRCGCSALESSHSSGERFYTCRSCKRDFWFTSGTLFDGVVRLRAWLAAIFFKEQGLVVSGSKLARLTEISSSTALSIQKKISLVLLEEMNDTISVSADSFTPVIFRRSRQTPAECHPRAELTQPGEQSWQAEISPRMKSRIKVVVSHLLNLIGENFHGVSKKCLQLHLASLWCAIDRQRWSTGAVLFVCMQHAPIKLIDVFNFISSDRVSIGLALPG